MDHAMEIIENYEKEMENMNNELKSIKTRQKKENRVVEVRQ